MKIGILTGGGDCPGLNPAIRGFVMKALDYGFTVHGIREGWKGLVQGIVEEQPLTWREWRRSSIRAERCCAPPAPTLSKTPRSCRP